MNWRRPVAAVLVAATLTVGSVGVAPKAKADPGGASMAGVSWVDEAKIFFVFWMVSKALDALVAQMRWQRWLYGTGCGTVRMALQNGVDNSMQQFNYTGEDTPPGLAERIANNLAEKVGCA